MDTDGKVNDLGRQYIGADPPHTTGNYIPGVVSGGEGEQSENSNTGGLSPTSVLPSTFGPFAVALFVMLLI